MLLPAENFEKLWGDFHAQAEIKPADEYDMDVMAIRDGLVRGFALPEVGDKDFQVRTGELTIVAGQSGHGKSLITGQFALDFARAHIKSCLMSFEMTPARTLDRMLSQCVGRSADTETAIKALQTIGKDVFVLDKVGSVRPSFVYGAIISAARDYGCKQIFVDNLMKCVDEFGDAGMNGTKNFVATLCELAKALKCHIWLVHHVRKSEKVTDTVDKYSIRGAAVVTDQADNILILQRNLVKEQKFDEQGFDLKTDNDEPDATLTVAKQRNGSWQGKVSLWFNREFLEYSGEPTRSHKPFIFQNHKGAL